jgi:hypothetical protein
VRAFDGVFEDSAYVDIKIENVNDNPPKFLPYKKNITIMEEQLVPGCIMTVSLPTQHQVTLGSASKLGKDSWYMQ